LYIIMRQRIYNLYIIYCWLQHRRYWDNVVRNNYYTITGTKHIIIIVCYYYITYIGTTRWIFIWIVWNSIIFLRYLYSYAIIWYVMVTRQYGQQSNQLKTTPRLVSLILNIWFYTLVHTKLKYKLASTIRQYRYSAFQ